MLFCSQRMYLLKQLKSQGLGIKQLHTVFAASIVSRVLWALHVCGGFFSSDLLNKIESMLRKAFSPNAKEWGEVETCMHKFGYTTEVLKVTAMFQNADNKFFSLMFRS